MSTTTEEIPLPDGADPSWRDDWEPEGFRFVWSLPEVVSNQDAAAEDVRCVVIQYSDGTIAVDGDDAPMVYVGDSSFTLEDARKLTHAILKAADLAESWTRGPCTLSCPKCGRPAHPDPRDSTRVEHHHYRETRMPCPGSWTPIRQNSTRGMGD